MAATLLSTRPKDGEAGGQCVLYAGARCFGKLFGANHAKEIWTNTKTNTGAALHYQKFSTMPTPPCCIVWAKGTSGHVGVIEHMVGSGTSARYTYSDSNRHPNGTAKRVSVLTNKTEAEIKSLLSSFSGYVQFD